MATAKIDKRAIRREPLRRPGPTMADIAARADGRAVAADAQVEEAGQVPVATEVVAPAAEAIDHKDPVRDADARNVHQLTAKKKAPHLKNAGPSFL